MLRPRQSANAMQHGDGIKNCIFYREIRAKSSAKKSSQGKVVKKKIRIGGYSHLAAVKSIDRMPPATLIIAAPVPLRARRTLTWAQEDANPPPIGRLCRSFRP